MVSLVEIVLLRDFVSFFAAAFLELIVNIVTVNVCVFVFFCESTVTVVSSLNIEFLL